MDWWVKTIRKIRIGLAVIIPVGIYAVIIWYFLDHFELQVTLAVALALPIVIFIVALVWAAVVSGLYRVICDSARRRVTASHRNKITQREEQVTQEVATSKIGP